MTTKTFLAITSALCIALLFLCLYAWQQRDIERERVRLLEHGAAALRKKIDAAAHRAVSADADVEILLSAVEANRVSTQTAAAALDSQDSYDEMKRRADQRRRNGQIELAVADYRWCYEHSSAKPLEKARIRTVLTLLSRTSVVAREALTNLRDLAEKHLAANPSDMQIAQDLGALNHCLNEKTRTLEIFDSAQPGSPLRKILGPMAFDPLVEVGRFQDAVSVKAFSTMIYEADHWRELSRAVPPELKDEQLSGLFMNFKALVGASQLGEAKIFADRLLSSDSSQATFSRLTQIAIAAGHPELVALPK
jgi:hypothetical protein